MNEDIKRRYPKNGDAFEFKGVKITLEDVRFSCKNNEGNHILQCNLNPPVYKQISMWSILVFPDKNPVISFTFIKSPKKQEFIQIELN